MTDIAKILVITGIIFVIAGLAVNLFSKMPGTGLGKLPGDILIKKENYTFYFPVVTCILVSFILSILLFLWNRK